MAYTPIEVNRDALTIMGVPFPDRFALESAASALGSSMFEGFVPTSSLVEPYRDFCDGLFPISELPSRVKELI